jgi:hypothetical protein
MQVTLALADKLMSATAKVSVSADGNRLFPGGVARLGMLPVCVWGLTLPYRGRPSWSVAGRAAGPDGKERADPGTLIITEFFARPGPAAGAVLRLRLRW